VRVRDHVDRHSVDPGREVRAVVEIEAAQEHLIRFAGAAVLRDDHAGHGLEDLAGAHARAGVELGGADDAFRRRHALPDRIVPSTEHDDVVFDACWRSVGSLGEQRAGCERSCGGDQWTQRGESVLGFRRHAAHKYVGGPHSGAARCTRSAARSLARELRRASGVSELS